MNSSLLMTPTVSRGHAVALSTEAISQAAEQLKDAFLEYLEGNIVREAWKEGGYTCMVGGGVRREGEKWRVRGAREGRGGRDGDFNPSRGRERGREISVTKCIVIASPTLPRVRRLPPPTSCFPMNRTLIPATTPWVMWR